MSQKSEEKIRMGLTGGEDPKGSKVRIYPQGKEAREPRMNETGYTSSTGVKSGKQGSEEGNKKTRICSMRIETVVVV